MLDQLRQRLTYANVMATVAVFIALGGSSYAALQIDSGDIANNSVRGVDVRNRTLSDRDVKRNGLTGRSIRESRLGRVPRAREADRLGGMTAADLRCEVSGAEHSSSLMSASRQRHGRPFHMTQRWSSARLQGWRPGGPGRRLPTHGELRAALSGVQLAAWRRAHRGGLSLVGKAGRRRSPRRHRPGRQRDPHREHSSRRQGIPLRHRPQELTRCEITPTRKECDVIAECSPTAPGGSFRAAVPPELSCLPSRSAGRLARGRRDRVAADAGGARGRPARVLGCRRAGGRGGRGA